MLASRYTPPPLESDPAGGLTLMRPEDREQYAAKQLRSGAASIRSTNSKTGPNGRSKRNVRSTGGTTQIIPEDSMSDHSFGMLSTQSLVGSLIDYPCENGRTYHSVDDDAYFMPNDDREADRLSVSHQMHLTLLSARLHLAPLPTNVTHILDVGTGTGEWAIDMADSFPQAEVIGIDLSTMQPNAVPTNVFFEVENAESEWEFSHQFDFIHIRNLAGALDSWPGMYARAFKFLKPGGYIEVSDHDRPVLPDEPFSTATKSLVEAFDAACKASGRPFNIDHLDNRLFAEAGFVDIQRQQFNMPIGGPPMQANDTKWLAKLGLVTITDGIEAFVLRPLTKWGGWSVEDVGQIVKQVQEEFIQMSNLPEGGHTPVHVMTARKPQL